jgi:hypothetical protein
MANGGQRIEKIPIRYVAIGSIILEQALDVIELLLRPQHVAEAAA